MLAIVSLLQYRLYENTLLLVINTFNEWPQRE